MRHHSSALRTFTRPLLVLCWVLTRGTSASTTARQRKHERTRQLSHSQLFALWQGHSEVECRCGLLRCSFVVVGGRGEGGVVRANSTRGILQESWLVGVVLEYLDSWRVCLCIGNSLVGHVQSVKIKAEIQHVAIKQPKTVSNHHADFGQKLCYWSDCRWDAQHGTSDQATEASRLTAGLLSWSNFGRLACGLPDVRESIPTWHRSRPRGLTHQDRSGSVRPERESGRLFWILVRISLIGA